jgi:hypothetical protein
MDTFHPKRGPQFLQQIADSLRKNRIQGYNTQIKVQDLLKEM